MTSPINLDDPGQGGLWIATPADLDALNAAAHARGLLVRRASLLGCADKGDLLRRVAAMLDFPATFGHNWDGLADCLADLAWLPTASGYAWLLDHAGSLYAASGGDFDTLCDVLRHACGHWRARGVACYACIAFGGAIATRPG
ncbi:MAG: barnase inhibitor [Rhodanobacteraceae bacterium]|nr:MAG: barnase inhibitor [Rhodanobacteraceae bacterium]